MRLDRPEGDWVETGVKLIIRKADLDPDLLAESIPVPPTSLSLPGEGGRSIGMPDEGVWVLAVHKSLPGGVDEQLQELVGTIETFSSSLLELAERGHEMSVDISGSVGSSSTFTLSPDTVSRLARLDIPLTVSADTGD